MTLNGVTTGFSTRQCDASTPCAPNPVVTPSATTSVYADEYYVISAQVEPGTLEIVCSTSLVVTNRCPPSSAWWQVFDDNQQQSYPYFSISAPAAVHAISFQGLSKVGGVYQWNLSGNYLMAPRVAALLSVTHTAMIIALTNSKGGVGKSTLAVHLAVWIQEQGTKVALVDADVQGSSSAWLKEASPELPLFRLATPDDILDQVPKIAAEFECVVIDGPAGLSELTRTILFLADVTFLPCGPSVLDLRAANDAIRVVRQVQTIRKGPPAALLVPNKLQIQYRLSRELLETAKALDIPAASGLKLRQAYADAAGQGTVVWRMGPRAQDAAQEIQTLFKELLSYEHADETTDECSVENA